jgi:choline dehydrogenase-like flavoprotein
VQRLRLHGNFATDQRRAAWWSRYALLAATLRSDCYVYRIDVGAHDRIENIAYIDASGAHQNLAVGPKGVVVLAASAIEDARLLLNSGLGARNDNIGRHLMFHFQATVVGVFPERLHSHRGRPITHMIDDFCGPAELSGYTTGAAPRGGTIELGGSQNVIDEGKNVPVSGTVHKQLMRQSPTRDHLAAMTMQGEDLPQAANRRHRSRAARPRHPGRARHAVQIHAPEPRRPPTTRRSCSRSPPPQARSSPPLGADQPRILPPELEGQVSNPATNLVPGSRHLLGGLRLGDDPATSVTDRYGKFHDFENLYAADGSLFVTSAGMNPSLTIMALGHRVGCAILNRANPEAARQVVDGSLFA